MVPSAAQLNPVGNVAAALNIYFTLNTTKLVVVVIPGTELSNMLLFTVLAASIAFTPHVKPAGKLSVA